MDINVRITLDASDKLAHLIQALASAVSHCGKPEPASTAPVSRDAYNSLAAPAPAPVSQTASELSAVPEPKPAPAPAPAPAPEPAQNAKALTIDDVRRVCLRATKAGKTKVVTDFLDANGVKNLPTLDPALYDALVAVVEDNL